MITSDEERGESKKGDLVRFRVVVGCRLTAALRDDPGNRRNSRNPFAAVPVSDPL